MWLSQGDTEIPGCGGRERLYLTLHFCIHTHVLFGVSEEILAWTEIPGGGGRGRLYLTLHCHHQNHSCFQMDSDERRLNVSFIVRDKVTRQCPQTTFQEKGEPKRNRTEVLLLTKTLKYYYWMALKQRKSLSQQQHQKTCMLPRARAHTHTHTCSLSLSNYILISGLC